MISACNNKVSLNTSSPNLQLDNGVLLYNNHPFNGNLIDYHHDGGIKSDIQYVDGRKNGYEKHWFSDESLAVERYYTKGLKTGIHKAYWKSGFLKFEYHFNEKGEYHGNVKEWYKTNILYRDFNYINGKEAGKQRLWKSNGTIKANYEVVNGERFGLIGLKKCKTVTVNSTEVK